MAVAVVDVGVLSGTAPARYNSILEVGVLRKTLAIYDYARLTAFAVVYEARATIAATGEVDRLGTALGRDEKLQESAVRRRIAQEPVSARTTTTRKVRESHTNSGSISSRFRNEVLGKGEAETQPASRSADARASPERMVVVRREGGG